MYFHSPVREPMSRRGEVVEIGGTPVEAYAFPNDRRLRGLRTFARRDLCLTSWREWSGAACGEIADADSLQRLLMRYVPEHKCVIRLRAEWRHNNRSETTKRRLLVRAASPANCGELLHRHQTLSRMTNETGEHFRVARPEGVRVEQGLLALEWLRGEGLLDVLHDASVEEDVLSGIARRLARFHSLEFAGLPVLSVERLIKKANEAFIDLCAGCPELVSRLFVLRRTLVGALRRLTPGRRATLHGDFHWKQLVFKGGGAALLDLERMCHGDAAIDVANFAAQLEMLAHRAGTGVNTERAARWARVFRAAWQRAAGDGIEARRLGVYSAASRLELARGMLRHVRPGWRAFCVQAVACAEADLATVSPIQEAA